MKFGDTKENRKWVNERIYMSIRKLKVCKFSTCKVLRIQGFVKMLRNSTINKMWEFDIKVYKL